MHGVVIEFVLAGSWSIWQEWIVGYQGCGIGLGWHEILDHGTADSIFHGFPAGLSAQQAPIPLLAGLLTGTS